jgi:hypothetical protein
MIWPEQRAPPVASTLTLALATCRRGDRRVQGRAGVGRAAPAGGRRAPAVLRPADRGAPGDRVRVRQPAGARDVDQGRGAAAEHRRRAEAPGGVTWPGPGLDIGGLRARCSVASCRHRSFVGDPPDRWGLGPPSTVPSVPVLGWSTCERSKATEQSGMGIWREERGYVAIGGRVGRILVLLGHEV